MDRDIDAAVRQVFADARAAGACLRAAAELARQCREDLDRTAPGDALTGDASGCRVCERWPRVGDPGQCGGCAFKPHGG